MDDSKECINEFNAACEEMIKSKYIVADKKITRILQSIAKSRILYTIIENSMVDFSFAEQLKESRQVDSYGRGLFILPRKRRNFIALVFCLLFSFDTRQTDLRTFIDSFYYSEISVNNEFYDFCDAVMTPFYNYINEEFNDMCGQNAKSPYISFSGEVASANDGVAAVNVANQPLNNVTNSNIDSEEIDLLRSNMDEIIATVKLESDGSGDEIKEFLLICYALCEAIDSGIKRTIKPLFLSLRLAVNASSFKAHIEKKIESLENLMMKYEI